MSLIIKDRYVYKKVLFIALASSVKASTVPELSPAEHRGEALALGLCVSMKLQIFFSTHILPNLQESSLLQQL